MEVAVIKMHLFLKSILFLQALIILVGCGRSYYEEDEIDIESITLKQDKIQICYLIYGETLYFHPGVNYSIDKINNKLKIGFRRQARDNKDMDVMVKVVVNAPLKTGGLPFECDTFSYVIQIPTSGLDIENLSNVIEIIEQ